MIRKSPLIKRLLLAAFILMAAPSAALAQQCTPQSGGSQITAVQASTTGTTGAVSATLAAVANQLTYVCGFSITSGGATTATTRAATLAGMATTMNYAYVDPTASQGNLTIVFPICIRSSAPNTAITLSVPGTGTGTVATAVNLWGCNQ
jgi:hypothetical protein